MTRVTSSATTAVEMASVAKTQKRPRRASRNWCRFTRYLLEEAHAHVDHVVRAHLVGHAGADLLHAAAVLAVDLDAALGAARVDAAAQRDRLHHGHVGL